MGKILIFFSFMERIFFYKIFQKSNSYLNNFNKKLELLVLPTQINLALYNLLIFLNTFKVS